MGQLTLYLDTQTEQAMKAAARAAGLSRSRWVANLIRARAGSEWPDSVVRLAGAWSDFPLAEELRQDLGEDVAREPI